MLFVSMCGSSPLARGLLPDDGDDYRDARIIPARAGFTGLPSAGSAQNGDHPRSRGVYTDHAAIDHQRGGSSPLARGLRCTYAWNQETTGIIPARAGFTDRFPAAARVPGDHPRSRGVYARKPHPLRKGSGSSPLARGLHAVVEHVDDFDGIIPARAGFTPGSSTPAPPPSDHPRSRGVYAAPPCRPAGSAGSSPLARGLPRHVGHARRPHPDHPRSRGVYAIGGFSYNTDVGSSPLARGLPGKESTWDAFSRIIPARAGFTPCCGERRGHVRDHPRSRGVYEASQPSSVRAEGSSPLARGLPASTGAQLRRLRIIPARAGFTVREGRVPAQREDHPRSRGVYSRTEKIEHAAAGSSPLARGLLR